MTLEEYGLIQRFQIELTETVDDSQEELILNTVYKKEVSAQDAVELLRETVKQHPEGGFDQSGLSSYYWIADNGNVMNLFIDPTSEQPAN